ncbi:MAG: hypothetical protein U9R49_05850 [Bacteroidota bacterium]|nr:hypothetical protein [Bacteroidota bacterium]
MKKLIALACTLGLTLLFVLGTAAQDKKEALWLVGEEKVKPQMIDQYYEVSKELAELCKAENFPYSYYVWVTQPFHYSLWYHLEDMNDITKIEEAWDVIIEKFGAENFKRFQECIVSQNEKVMAVLLNLSYEPEPPRLSEEEVAYCYWQEVTVKKGSEKAVEDLFKKAFAIMEEKETELTTYIGKGKIGYDQPVYFAWYPCKDQMDYLEQEKKFEEMVGEDWKQINGEIVKHIKGIRNVNMWWTKDISYEKEE